MAKLNFAIKLGLAAQGFQQGLNSAKSSLQGFASSVKSAFGMIAGALAAGQIKAFGQECLAAFKAQQTAEVKLSTVMKQRMNATDAEVKSILKLTSAQQQAGVIGDEVQIAGAQQVATFLKQKSSIDTLIPAMNNLLAQQKGLDATQGDAVGIANLMGKAMMGQTSALRRVGITFDEAQEKVLKYGTESERAATLAQVITDNVGNMNAELAKTDLGKIQQMENILGDTKEQIGGAIAPIVSEFAPAIANMAVNVANGITSAIGFIKDNFAALVIHITSIFAGIKFATLGKSLIAGFKGIGASIESQSRALAARVEAIDAQMLNKKVQIERMKLKASKDGLNEESAYYKKIKQQEAQYEQLATNKHKAQVEARLARLRAYQYQNASIFGKIGILMGNAFKGIGTAMKTAFSTVWPMLLITAITECVMWLGKMIAKGNEMAEVQKDIKKAAAETSYAQQADELEILKKRLEEAHKKHLDEKTIMDECNRALGTTETKYDNLNRKLDDRIAKLRKAAEIEGAKDVLKRLGAEKAELLIKKKEAEESVKAAKEAAKQNNTPGPKTSGGAYMPSQVQGSIGISGEVSAAQSQVKSIDQNLQSIDKKINLVANMVPSNALGNGGGGSGSGGGGSTGGGHSGHTGGGSHTETPAEKAEKQYADAQTNYSQAIEKAKMRLENGIDTQDDYEKKVYSALETLYGAYSDAYATHPEQKYKDAMEETAKLLKDQGEKVKKATEAEEARKKAEEADKDYLKASAEIAKQQAKGRDTTFDYKSTNNEKVQAQLEFDLDIAQQQLEALKQKAETLGVEAIDGLVEAESKVKSLEDLLKLEKVKQDVAELREEMKNVWMETGKSSWSDIEGSVNNIKSCIDTFNDPDADAWDKFCAVMDTLTSLFETYSKIMDTVNGNTETSNKLSDAEAQQKDMEAAATLNASSAQQQLSLSHQQVEQATKQSTQAINENNNALMQTVAACQAAANALAQQAAAQMYADDSDNASDKIGSMKSTLQGLQIFARGGFIRGAYSHGDRVLIRANANEAILNPMQQRNFMRLANGGGIQTGNGGGEVKFKIEGRTLVGVLGNESTRSSKIK